MDPMQSEATIAPAEGRAVAAFTKRYAKYALVVIFFANFLSYCDRQIVSALERELTHTFGLTEEAFGALWSAFTVGYMVFAPVVGFLADRNSRPRIFAVCVFIWSFATIGSGLAHTKAELFAARFLIGIGEAGCLVLGPSLIADYFDKQHRGRVLSIFFLGLPLGGFAGYLLAAAIVSRPHDKVPHGVAEAKPVAVQAAPVGDAPPAEEVSAETGVEEWRVAFWVAGAPGILLAFFVWSLVDPPRGGDDDASHRIHGLKPYLGLFRNRTLLLIILSQAAAVIFLVPLLHFGVKFFETKYHMSKARATVSLGTTVLIAGLLGTALSGFLGDKLARRIKGAYALLAAAAFLIAMPWLLLGFMTRVRWQVFPALGAGAFCCFVCMPAVNTQIANCVPAKQRGMAFALAVFILHLLGDTLSPLVFGQASHMWGRGRAYVVFSGAMLVAGLLAFFAFLCAPRDEMNALREDAA